MDDRVRIPAPNLPEGTVTFLFTDIEGSTELLKALGDRYAELLQAQRQIVRDITQNWSGTEVDTQGDSFFLSFPRASQAVSAAIEIQQAIHEYKWPDAVEVRLRMGLHTGEPLAWAEGYVGIDVHRAARIAAVGHGGQVLLSQTTTPLAGGSLPEGVSILDLGRHRLKDMHMPERIGQLAIEGRATDFPPLKSVEVLPDEVHVEIAATQPPAFLSEDVTPPAPPVFVARERELSWLEGRLERAMAGEGGIAFITGGPGRGKSALVEVMIRRAMTTHPGLLAARGECSAHTGVGDPYQPFRGALRMLFGDLEAAWAAGLLDRTAALRLWSVMPHAAQLLLETGLDLFDVFVPGRALYARLQAALEGRTPWLRRFGEHLDTKPGAGDRTLRNLAEQVEGFLGALSDSYPLLLVLDDLQWADTASINLLFHLGRRLKGKRILLVGAFRSEEVSAGLDDRPHPLEIVVSELKRLHGEIEIDLSEEREGAADQFIQELLNSEPNRLSEGFHRALCDHTEGHPLFTIELLRALQTRGVLVKDDRGEWYLEGELDWGAMPARVEGVIEERLGRLDPGSLQLLTAASVEGVTFSAQATSQAAQLELTQVVDRLSTVLSKVHRLVSEQGVNQASGERLFQFRFRHLLFQQYLYESLGDHQRELMHGKVARYKETLFGEKASEIAAELAHHYAQAGEREKAVEYLLKVGDRARFVYAHEQALTYYKRALDMMDVVSQPELAARTHMKVGLVHSSGFEFEQADAAYTQAFDLWGRVWKKAAQAPEASRTLRFAIAEPLTMDPGRMNDDVSTFLARQLYEGLVRVEADRSLLPAIAERWEVLDGGERYRFHLREGVFWSDGRPLTASDFEYAWKRNLRLPDNAPAAALLFVIEGARAYREKRIPGDRVGVKAVDDLTLEVRLTSPCAYLPHLLTLPISYPLPRWAVREQEGYWTHPSSAVVNGAYRLRCWESAVKTGLERNPHYLGGFSGNIGSVAATFLSDFRNAFDRYAEGALDGVSMITSDPLSGVEARQRFGGELRLTPQASTLFLLFRVDRPPFDDVRVRRAFAQTIDREALVQETLQGLYAPGTGGFLPPSMPAYAEESGLAFEPEGAQPLLHEAIRGKAGGIGDLELIYTGGSVFDPVVATLRKGWEQHLDVAVSLTSVDWPTFFERLAQDPAGMAFMGYSADYPDPDAMLRVLFHSQEGYNHPGWEDEAFDRLVLDASRMADPQARLEAYCEADRLLVREAVIVVPLAYAQGRTLVKPYLEIPPVAPMWMLFKEMSLGKE